MIPGRRTSEGQLVVTAGPPLSTDPRMAGFALKPTGEIYASGGQSAFTPEDLFLNGEQGAWYDPSDLTTMFQDREGSTPVTADGQTVGLILDKSKGLVLGSELVTNGDFSNGTANWSPVNSSTLSTDSGGIRITNTVEFPSSATQEIATVSGKTYKVTVQLLGFGGGAINGQVRVGTTLGAFDLGYVTSSSISTITLYFTATGATSYVSLMSQTTTIGAYGVYDNVSVKEIAGNHATAPSDAARPLKTSTGAADWTNYDAVDDVLNTTFPSSLGSSCTVCRANVGAAPTILTAQTIGTSYADSTDNAGLIIINRALTGQETTDVTAWLTAKGAT